ncbi:MULTISPECIES: molybdenum cofactor guanylyltransferase [unclassified Paenibacillus]|uniref:molybdenum cofactor guanylyltransferase n=1 Tax=unclassified Paenibacillus TaxID=185978 RepID=UPI0036D2CB47
MMSGVILAGGDHLSMNGVNRAFLVMEGETLIERQIREMGRCCSEITIVTNDPRPFLRTVDRDIRIITDYFVGKGLLSGMHAGLALSKYDRVWLLGCHMPFPSAEAARYLNTHMREGIDAVIPCMKSGAYPLHAIFNRVGAAARIEKLLKSGYFSKTALLNALNWRKVEESTLTGAGIDGRFVHSLRTKEDYDRLAGHSIGTKLPQS